MKVNSVEELKKLNEVKSIKEVEAQLKVLQNNWDEIGPVPNEEWESMKEGYSSNYYFSSRYLLFLLKN